MKCEIRFALPNGGEAQRTIDLPGIENAGALVLRDGDKLRVLRYTSFEHRSLDGRIPIFEEVDILEIEKHVLLDACPACGAPAGEPCRDPLNQSNEPTHQKRLS